MKVETASFKFVPVLISNPSFYTQLFMLHQTGIFLIYGDLVSNISHLKLARLMNLNCK